MRWSRCRLYRSAAPSGRRRTPGSSATEGPPGGLPGHHGIDAILPGNEEDQSTSWPAVSRPTYVGGLGFGFKWNMGWMHDTLEYFSQEPIHRRYHHDELTFGLLYAFTENFVLPLSHDEVVHGKSSLLNKMPGDRWQKAANLRALLGWMWAHPGKQLLFMGGEIAQSEEWDYQHSLDWHLLQYPEHKGVQDLVRALNRLYLAEPALFERDFTPDGFRWIDASDVESNVLAFLRIAEHGRPLACIANLSPVPRTGYRIGLPRGGVWQELLNTDLTDFAGSGVGNGGGSRPPRRAGTACPPRWSSRCRRWPCCGSCRRRTPSSRVAVGINELAALDGSRRGRIRRQGRRTPQGLPPGCRCRTRWGRPSRANAMAAMH